MGRKVARASGRRAWKKLNTPPSWIKPGARVLWHFVMSYNGDGKPGRITGEPYQTGAGDWLVRVELDEGRSIPAAIEALDEVRT